MQQLADRLNKAQDLQLGGGTELAPPSDSIQAEALPPKDIVAAQEDSTKQSGKKNDAPIESLAKEEGVGHAMVEGAAETAEEIHEKLEEEVENAKTEVTQPAVLDEVVAELVTREEIKEKLPPTPSPPRAISPAPPSAQRSRAASTDRKDEKMGVEVEPSNGVQTPPLPSAAQPGDADDYAGHSSKRPRDDGKSSSPGPSKRARPAKTYNTPLPRSLSHLLHPPTSTIYITNLRRPLLLSTLYDYIDPSLPMQEGILPSPRAPFQSEDTPGLWLSGIKDHAYATYPSVEEALEVVERIENVKWPEDTGSELHVEFIPDEKVFELVQKEEIAWSNERQKLSLRIEKGEGGDWDFRLEGGMASANGQRGPPALPGAARMPSGQAGFGDRRGPALSGANAIMGRAPPNAPMGPGSMRSRPGQGVAPGRNGDMGRFGRDQPPLGPGRYGRDGALPPRGDSGRPGQGRFGNGDKVTRARPGLIWREGPGAMAR